MPEVCTPTHLVLMPIKLNIEYFFNEDIASKTLYEQQYSNDDVRVNKFILSVVNPAIR